MQIGCSGTLRSRRTRSTGRCSPRRRVGERRAGSRRCCWQSSPSIDRCRGQGLGRELLIVALETIVEAVRRVGGKVAVVDAIDAEAAAFYERHDFVVTRSDPNRLVKKPSTIAKALELPWL